jgi:phospholipid/cholesterol/gamma-HCH transport system substrate-binding protein
MNLTRLTALADPAKLLALGAVLLALVASFFVLRPDAESRTLTARFSRAVQIYEDSEVRILGVPVGRVTSVVPDGDAVRVEMEYDAEHDVPAEAQAVIVTPTLTADRFVQLTPAYTKGPKLKDGAEIDVQDTGTPIELDRIYRSLADVTRALGPNGVNRNGTLDEVLTSGSKFLDGQGRRANTTIVNLSRAVKTFGDGSGELFGTVRALSEFADVLAANDAAVSSFMGNLGQVSQQLAGESEELQAALSMLAAVVGDVERFVKGNRQLLVKDVENLTRIVKTMGDESKALETILDIAPSALNNLAVAFDFKSGTIGSRLNFGPNIASLDQLLCGIVQGAAGKSGGISRPLAELACGDNGVLRLLLEPVTDPLSQNVSAPGGGRRSSGDPVQVRHGDGPAADNLEELLGGVA